MSAELVVIERDIFVAASPETVFGFLTDAVLLANWIGASHQVDATPGGLLRIRFDRGDVARGQYQEVSPNRRVVFTWGWEPTPEGQDAKLTVLPPGASLVEVDLEPKDEGTLLHFRHSHVPKEIAESHGERWSYYFAQLQAAASVFEVRRRRSMILITGATGTNGAEIVKLLSRMGVRCRALVRTEEKAGALSGLTGVEVVHGDFERPETLSPALEGIDKALLISSIDPRLPEIQGKFIQAAKRAGVSHLVKFSGAWKMGKADLREWKFARWHADAEKILKDSGLAFTHLQPNQFMQVYLRFQATISAQGKFFAACGDSKVSPVDVRDIAAVAATMLTEPGHEGKSYVITGPEALTYYEVADKLSVAVGRQVVYVNVPLEQARKAMADSGAPDWFIEGQMEQYRVRLKGRQSEVTSTIAEVAKKEPITFDHFASHHASYFRSGSREQERQREE